MKDSNYFKALAESNKQKSIDKAVVLIEDGLRASAEYGKKYAVVDLKNYSAIYFELKDILNKHGYVIYYGHGHNAGYAYVVCLDSPVSEEESEDIISKNSETIEEAITFFKKQR